MSHLPNTDGHQNEGLHDGPPEDPLVGALTGLTETLLAVLREDRQGAINNCGYFTELKIILIQKHKVKFFNIYKDVFCK